MNERIKRLREKMTEEKLSAYIITSYENYRYFSGFTGSNCALVILKDACFALTDGRYDIQIREQAPGFSHVIISRSMHEHIAELIPCGARVGYETHTITDFMLRNIKSQSENAEFVPCPDFGEEIRAVKDDGEITAIRRAVNCSDEALTSLIPQITRGMTERQAAALLEYEMAKRGSEKAAFSTIAASGLHSALPHAEPMNKEIADNCLFTLDFGATINGYCSDITRTLIIGNPARELTELWELVFDVQQKCIQRVTPGMRASELDEYQRSLFADCGMEKYVMHSLGHGVGLAIHEAPTVSRRSDTILQKNMVITIEPGLYIENLGGVRIEDTVLVTADGAEVLTKAPHRINIKL